MKAIHRRLQKLEAQLVPEEESVPAEPASVRWAKVLRICLPWLERKEQKEPAPETAAVIERVRRNLAFIDDYVDRYLPDHPWPHMEYFCGICLSRLGWTAHGWEDRRLAFLDADYEDHFRQIEEIETARLRTLIPYVPSHP